jgi:hypothetical protein
MVIEVEELVRAASERWIEHLDDHGVPHSPIHNIRMDG